MPFDQFTIKQIAGDLLPNATTDDKVATGFNRNTMINEEGGVDPEEYRYYSCIDRVNTTATVFMAATLQCAQCHNHKYDPFSQKDYYQFLAYFNSTEPETQKPPGGDPGDTSPRVVIDTPEYRQVQATLDSLGKQLEITTPQLARAQADWEAAASSNSTWTTLAVSSAQSTAGATLAIQPDGSILAGGANPPNDTYLIDGKVELPKLAAIRLEALPDSTLAANGPGRAGNGNFALTHLSLELTDAGADNLAPFLSQVPPLTSARTAGPSPKPSKARGTPPQAGPSSPRPASLTPRSFNSPSRSRSPTAPGPASSSNIAAPSPSTTSAISASPSAPMPAPSEPCPSPSPNCLRFPPIAAPMPSGYPLPPITAPPPLI